MANFLLFLEVYMNSLPTLYTERLIIRPISLLDADDMYEYAKTPLVGPTAGWAPHTSIQETISIIKAMMTIKTPYELGVWAIVLKTNNKMIGTIELYNYYYHFKAELGYSVNPSYWGKGYATEAAQTVIAYGFEFLNLKRIEVGTFIDNFQSQRVCEKLGFIKEGIARNGYVRYDGKIFDKLIFGMTNKEYAQIYKKERMNIV